MNHAWLSTIFCLPIVLGSAFKSLPIPNTELRTFMELNFTNISEAKGKVLVAVYASEADFLNENKAVLREVVDVNKTGNVNIKLDLAKEGQYAIAAFHDLNGNQKLDTNFLGVPTEPYAFSNNARPKFRAPTWGEAGFYWKPGGGMVTLKLEKW